MIKFTFKRDGAEVTMEFDKYSEMLRFVAMSRIKDEDFVSLQFGEDDDEDKEEIIGIDGLVDKAIETADRMDAFEAAMMEAMEEDEDSDIE